MKTLILYKFGVLRWFILRNEAMGNSKNKISLNYLIFMSDRDNLLGGTALSFKELRILRFILFAYIQKNLATVNDILPLIQWGSPSTNHALLKKLIKKKYVLSEQNKEDLRIKFLHPTEKTFELFHELSSLFRKYSELESGLEL